jgi:hypothetical protein
VSARTVAEERAEITRLSLDVCYPDGSQKLAEWGKTWIAATSALILSEASMDKHQQDLFRGKRKLLRRRKWSDRPTLIRATEKGRDEPLCMFGEFPSNKERRNGDSGCQPQSKERGIVLGAALHIRQGDRLRIVKLDTESMRATSTLIFNRVYMTEGEWTSFNRHADTVAIRRLLESGAAARELFEVVRCGSIGEQASGNYLLGVSCGLNGLAVKGWA